MLSFFAIGKRRWLTHLGLALLSAAGCYLTYLWQRDMKFVRVLTLGFGDVGMILLVVSLLIGPVYLVWRRRNPVNIYLRRDIGTWTAITGVLHVVFGLLVYEEGHMIAYFLKRTDSPGIFPYALVFTEPFRVSNYLGLIATLILLVLLIISNDLSVRWLKGRLWKFLQRFAYVLFVLIVVHALVYQFVVKRPLEFVLALVGLSALAVICQAAGFGFTLSRQIDSALARRRRQLRQQSSNIR